LIGRANGGRRGHGTICIKFTTDSHRSHGWKRNAESFFPIRVIRAIRGFLIPFANLGGFAPLRELFLPRGVGPTSK
jgi:hypothetical protein